MKTAALTPEPATPGAGPSARHAPRARPPPRGGGLWSCAASPSPKTGGSTNIRPVPPKSPPLVPFWPIGGRIFFGRQSSPSALAAHVCLFRESGVLRGRSLLARRSRAESCIRSFILRRTRGSVRGAPPRRRRSHGLCVLASALASKQAGV